MATADDHSDISHRESKHSRNRSWS